MTLPTRAGVLGLAAALSATCLSMLPLSAAQAAGVDPTPPNQATAWLKGQLQGGVLVDPSATPAGTDFAASLDAATGLAVLGDTASAAAIRDALAPQIQSWTGLAAATNANAIARTVWSVRALGGDPTNYGPPSTVGGTTGNRVSDLQGQVNALPAAPATPGTEAGKIFDDTGAPTTAGAANVVGQAYAAGAFARELPTDPVTPYVTTYLLRQQCAAGFFTATFAADGATCDSTLTKTPSVEATATAVVALAPRAGDATVKPAYDRAVAWLVAAQQSNGRWTTAGTNGPGDALSTGLAGYAVGLAGRPNPAAQAAVWLRGQQLTNAGTCPGYAAADLGAVALDGADYDSAPTTPVAASAVRTTDFRRATARSLAALKATPGGDAGTTTLVSVPRFSKPGKGVAVSVRGAARNTLCATAPGLAATKLIVNYDGTASYAFFAGASGSTTTTVVDAAGQQASATVTSLPKKKLGLKFRSKKVRFAKVAVVKISGLAPGESTNVKFRGKRKASGIANSSGQAKLRFIVTGKRGEANVKVAGQYGNRNRTKTLIVTRR